MIALACLIAGGILGALLVRWTLRGLARAQAEAWLADARVREACNQLDATLRRMATQLDRLPKPPPEAAAPEACAHPPEAMDHYINGSRKCWACGAFAHAPDAPLR